ncbi:MAG: hypothetical protein HOC24_07630 [Deltaproteobacteria bacterium]|jgi:predicted RNA binding protein YcfA (HicA-like mRNA interferase family)|nr:hypothetical protein [Deltaproteobacteria bacterium]
MILKHSEVESSLLRKGFQASGKKHLMYYFYYKNKKTPVFTFLSHGKQDIDSYLISKMSKQVKLSKKDYLDLINCPLTKEKYTEKLKGLGVIK